MTSNTGQRAKLGRPLDFLIVSDHAEFLGVAPAIKRGGEVVLADPDGRRWYDMFNAGPEDANIRLGKEEGGALLPLRGSTFPPASILGAVIPNKGDTK